LLLVLFGNLEIAIYLQTKNVYERSWRGTILEIKLILCPIDFSAISVRAYRHALSMAEHYQAKLMVLHVVEEWRHPSGDFAGSAADLNEFYRELQETGRWRLQEFVKNHTHEEIQPELVVRKGTAPDLILSSAQARNIDVIVMGTHGHRGLDRLLLGSTTDRVMRTASCPVIVVPPLDSMAAGDDLHDVRRLKRVLFCADFSENSAWVLDYAISVAAEYDAELTLLHVLEQSSNWDNIEDATTRAIKQLDKLLPPKAKRMTGKIKTAVRVGKPYRELIQYALEERPDLVVMGVRGRGALDLAVFGSTTYRVMQLGYCPVLIVHARPLDQGKLDVDSDKFSDALHST
jgi:nucleotide-binding universal stress UspA family protein